jgi:TDG/mug DNA glycosylase family protein
MHELDILDAGLKAVFCGINRPPSAELAGHNFSSSSNRFWSVLHGAGFTDVLLRPHDERRLLEYGYGITAVVDRATSKAADVSPQELMHARLGFEARMRRHAPRAVAFLGKRAFAMMMSLGSVEWGLQATRFAGTMTWVLPNPSGLNRSFGLDALVRSYAELRSAVEAARP